MVETGSKIGYVKSSHTCENFLHIRIKGVLDEVKGMLCALSSAPLIEIKVQTQSLERAQARASTYALVTQTAADLAQLDLEGGVCLVSLPQCAARA